VPAVPDVSMSCRPRAASGRGRGGGGFWGLGPGNFLGRGARAGGAGGGGGVRLERRPESAVWGGLWCLPEFSTASAAAAFIRDTLGVCARTPRALAELEHAFTHFDLTITPLLVHCSGSTRLVEEERGLWYNLREPARIGLPAPISALLARLADETLFERRT